MPPWQPGGAIPYGVASAAEAARSRAIGSMQVGAMTSKQLANAVLRQHWDGTLPVQPVAIATALNAKVIPDPDLGPISGQFSLEEEGPVIRYNSKEPPMRQRFTVAHEIGHYALGHGDYFRDPIRNFSTRNFDPKEAQANRFAAELLMPEIAVSGLIRERGITDVKALAREFQVSEAAMMYRLKNLGWTS